MPEQSCTSLQPGQIVTGEGSGQAWLRQILAEGEWNSLQITSADHIERVIPVRKGLAWNVHHCIDAGRGSGLILRLACGGFEAKDVQKLKKHFSAVVCIIPPASEISEKRNPMCEHVFYWIGESAWACIQIWQGIAENSRGRRHPPGGLHY